MLPTTSNVTAAAYPGSGARPLSALMAASEIGRPQPDLFNKLDPAARRIVLARGRRILFRKDQAVFRQSERHDGIFLIESGAVRVFYTAPTGREITLAYWMTGNFCGGPEVFGVGNHVWSGTAARDTSVISLSGRDLRALVDQFPLLAIGIIECLVFKGACYSHLAQLLGTRSVTERLVSVLHQLVRVYGRPASGGIEISMPFTHDDLASMVGATRQWVSMSLRRFSKEGLLALKRRRLVILDPARLSAMTEASEAL